TLPPCRSSGHHDFRSTRYHAAGRMVLCEPIASITLTFGMTGHLKRTSRSLFSRPPFWLWHLIQYSNSHSLMLLKISFSDGIHLSPIYFSEPDCINDECRNHHGNE